MKKTFLFALLPFAAIFAPVHASPVDVPQATIVSDSRQGDYLPDDQLYTESLWQSVVIPVDIRAQLGNLANLKLSVANMPSNVHIALVPEESPGQVGLSIWRTDKAQRVGQVGIFTLTNPVNHSSYTFQAMVMGAGT